MQTRMHTLPLSSPHSDPVSLNTEFLTLSLTFLTTAPKGMYVDMQRPECKGYLRKQTFAI